MENKSGVYKIEKHLFNGDIIINYVELNELNYDNYMRHLYGISFKYSFIVVERCIN